MRKPITIRIGAEFAGNGRQGHMHIRRCNMENGNKQKTFEAIPRI